MTWRPVLLGAGAALLGAAGTLLAGLAAGMGGGEVGHLALLMLPAAAVTVITAVAARPLLARSSLRQRLVAVGAVAVVVSLANLGVLAGLMFISPHDALLMGTLLVYSAGTGIGAALAVSRSSAEALDRLVDTARRLASGDLRARVGPLGAGPEVEALGQALDDMVDRLEASLGRERTLEMRRRDLITAVSHDLRTPLAGLRAMVEAIDEGVVEDRAAIRRYAAEMRTAVTSLSSLVNELFDLAQLDAGAIEAESARARLDEVVGAAVAACEVLAAEKGLVVETALDGTSASPCSPRLIRVLQNLLQNAIRHTPASGTVRVEGRPRPGGIEVAVEDNGEGIPPGDLDRVFEPFWRGDPARTGEGSGLGLALAKRIVEALGGRIDVESAATGGARFVVTLPMEGREAEAARW